MANKFGIFYIFNSQFLIVIMIIEKSKKVYALVDCDSFFASCEVLKDPRLRGKPVAVGKHPGVIVSATYEAKKWKVWTGTPTWEAQRILWDKLVLCEPDFATYARYSKRVMNFLEQYCQTQVVASIDECYMDVTGMNTISGMPFQQFGEWLRDEVKRNIGLPITVGIAPTRLLAKIFASMSKPHWALAECDEHFIDCYLSSLPIRKLPFLWTQSQKKLPKHISTIRDFKNLDFQQVKNIYWSPGAKLRMQLHCYDFSLFRNEEAPQSMSRRRSFEPNFTSDPEFLRNQIFLHFEHLYHKLIRGNLECKGVILDLKTKDFHMTWESQELAFFTHDREILLQTVKKLFSEVLQSGTSYRQTGLCLTPLRVNPHTQHSLFQPRWAVDRERVERLLETLHRKLPKGLVHRGLVEVEQQEKIFYR